jgi:hypothetical protein
MTPDIEQLLEREHAHVKERARNNGQATGAADRQPKEYSTAPLGTPVTPGVTLASVIATYTKWLYMPDPGGVEVTLATVAANLMPGDPLWLLLVGPPGSGKTEDLNPLSGLPHVQVASTLTEAALLSGTPAREKAKGAEGGLLRKIGEFGILICKDFGSILSMHRESRAAVLAALREIYDGSWTRHLGTDGGRTLAWAGKIGMLAGCNPGNRLAPHRPGQYGRALHHI